MRLEVPIRDKAMLTVQEAAAYFNLGENKIRELSSDDACGFVLWVGNKRLIKRCKFEKYLEGAFSV